MGSEAPSNIPTNKNEGVMPAIFNYGPWQRDILIIFVLYRVISAWHTLAVTFFAPNMKFHCADILNSSVVFQNSTNITEQVIEDDSHCNVILLPPNQMNYTDISNLNTTVVPCTEWTYDHSFYPETIVSKWDLVCSREWLISFAKSAYMIGFLLSVLICGQLADWVGRRPTILSCYAIATVSTILSAFSTSYTMFVFLRFLQAVGRAGVTTTGLVLLLEIITPKWRAEFGILNEAGWSVGFVVLPGIAWLVRNWSYLQLAVSLPAIPLVCMYWLVPESPRWLMAQGKTEYMTRVVEKAIKKNRVEITNTTSTIKNPETQVKGTKRRKYLFDLLKTPKLRMRILIMAYIWMVTSFIYYGLSYNTNELGGDPYVTFFLSGLMEFPAYGLTYYGLRKIGRKKTLISTVLICGVASAAIPLVPSDPSWIRITLSMLGKFCITGTYGTIYVYTTEAFPTVLRTIALGFCSTCARVGAVLAPFGREMGKSTVSTAPDGLNAALALLAGILVLCVPETKEIELPDTLQEAETLGKPSKTER